MTDEVFSYALDRIKVPHGRVLWLYGSPATASGDAYHPLQDKAEALRQHGCTVFFDVEAIGHDYDAVFVHCPKQREETEGLIALAFERSKGLVMAAAPNDAGGGRLQGMMKAYGINAEQLSKDKCKLVWTRESTRADKNAIAANLLQLQPRKVAMQENSWWSVPGLFGWNKIDMGSQLLLEYLPDNLAGKVADFGCGYGYLAVALVRRYPLIQQMDAYDVDARAVACCKRNGADKVNVFWQDIRTLPSRPVYDAIVMNPPFHSSKETDMALGAHFIINAWGNLKPGGRLFLVANRQLPYEKIVPGLAVLCEGQGYKVLAGRKP